MKKLDQLLVWSILVGVVNLGVVVGLRTMAVWDFIDAGFGELSLPVLAAATFPVGWAGFILVGVWPDVAMVHGLSWCFHVANAVLWGATFWSLVHRWRRREPKIPVTMGLPPEHLPVLEFCLAEIRHRAQDETRYDWRWRMREKVVTNCICLIRDGMTYEASFPSAALSDEEKATIRETHPLLTDENFRANESGLKSFAEWHERIREKVVDGAHRIGAGTIPQACR